MKATTLDGRHYCELWWWVFLFFF